MHWIIRNIGHITVPMGILLGLFSATVGFTVQRKRKAGLQPPFFPKSVRIGMTLFVVLSAVLFGITLAHTFG